MASNSTGGGLGQAVWRQLTATDFRLLEYLHYLSKRYTCVFPSQRTLAKRLAIAERTARRSVAHLKEIGLLLVHPRRFRNALGQIRSQSNAYRICTMVGAKIHGLVARVTGRTQKSRVIKTKEKKELSLTIS